MQCRQLLAKEIKARTSDAKAWQDALKAVHGGRRVDWSHVLAEAASDLHEAALWSAVNFASATAIRHGWLDVDAPAADLCFSLRMVTPPATIEMDARVDTQTGGGQWMLCVACDAGDAAYGAALHRFGAPGQGALWLRQLSGLRDLKNLKREAAVRLALVSAASDGEAFDLAAVSPAAGNRIKARLGLAKPRRRQ